MDMLPDQGSCYVKLLQPRLLCESTVREKHVLHKVKKKLSCLFYVSIDSAGVSQNVSFFLHITSEQHLPVL